MIAFHTLIFLGAVATNLTLDIQCDPNDNSSCVQPLLEGEIAPFSGQLLTPKRAAKLAVKAASVEERVKLAIAETEELWRIKLNTEKALRESDALSYHLKIDLLQKAANRPFYEHPLFVMTVTVASCVALYFTAVETVKATK